MPREVPLAEEVGGGALHGDGRGRVQQAGHAGERVARAVRNDEEAEAQRWENARTDVLLRRALSGAAALDEVVRRARRYVDAGCDGIFVPGFAAAEGLSRVAAEVQAPLNVWASPALPPIEQLRALGVRG
ncbi:isocitrate lyase/phosphoenolpyruvate mutase family protein [Sorangium sp. So ce388]|uniref:isocitrate lyase/phosphoenolpyruvate mutase family protein n=1 Tax=Sorangium sp. So ce388 TaxID=3133309 RepID=UPI003F5B55CA